MSTKRQTIFDNNRDMKNFETVIRKQDEVIQQIQQQQLEMQLQQHQLQERMQQQIQQI